MVEGQQPRRIELHAVAVTDGNGGFKIVEPAVAASWDRTQPSMAFIGAGGWTVGCTADTQHLIAAIGDWEFEVRLDSRSRGVVQPFLSPRAAFQQAGVTFAARIRRQATLELLRTPAHWPARPFLPVLRTTTPQEASGDASQQATLRGEFARVGVIHENALANVWVGLNLFDLPEFGGDFSPEEFFERGGHLHQYENVHELLADGWRAD